MSIGRLIPFLFFSPSVLTPLCSPCPWPWRGFRVYLFSHWRQPFHFVCVWVRYPFTVPGANSRKGLGGSVLEYLCFAWQSRSDNQCGAKCTLAVGLLAFAISQQATAVDQFTNWMGPSAAARRSRYRPMTRSAPKKFCSALLTHCRPRSLAMVQSMVWASLCCSRTWSPGRI